MAIVSPLSAADRAAAARHGRWLQGLTLAWNSAECAVALSAGVLAGSTRAVAKQPSAVACASLARASSSSPRRTHRVYAPAEQEKGRPVSKMFVFEAVTD
jgi:hypothetical protein